MHKSALDGIEPEYAEPFKAWQATPGPDSNALMLKTLHPVLEGAVKTHVGESNPLLMSRARLMALEGLRSYDAKKGKLRTHLYNHLQGLKRVQRQQTTILSVPERIALDRYHLANTVAEIAHELGREPTDAEIADRTGFSPRRLARVRSYVPALAEGTFSEAEEHPLLGGVHAPGAPSTSLWAEVVYDELDSYHRKVMEHALGLHGRPVLSNQEIARRMRRSPGAISQAKQRIQNLLNQEEDLSPFAS